MKTIYSPFASIYSNYNSYQIDDSLFSLSGVVDVIVYPSAADKSKNRGFSFVEYKDHKAAAMARRKLMPGRIQLWGHQIAVDWAEPEIEVEERFTPICTGPR